MSVAALVTLAIGFAPSFYLRSAARPALAAHVVAHAILFSTWIVLFVIQTTLVAIGRTGLHRRLGVAATALAVLMVITAPPMAVDLARRGVRGSVGDPLAFMLVMLVDLLLFGVFVAAAIYNRRRTDIHKRLMLLAIVSMLPPAISRWPIAMRHPAPVIMGVLLAFLLAPPINDLMARRRVHPVSLWGGLAVLASMPLRFAVAQTAAWHHIASWLIG